MINVAICTPTTGSVKAAYTASLLALVTHYFNTPIPGLEDEERKLGYNLMIGSNISQQREHMVEDALATIGTTHILFIDDDMGFEEDCLNLALSRQESIVLANYRRKAPPWAFTARRMDEGKAVEVVTDELNKGLEEVSFGGFGFCLMTIRVLQRLAQPRFLNRWIKHQNLYSTEDYPFFQTIHDEDIAKVYVDHELSRKIIHVGDYPYQFRNAPFGVRIRRPLGPSEVVEDFKAA